MQLQNLGTDVEKINRKEIDDLESDKSDTEERYKIKISDEMIMIDGKKDDDDDQSNNDTDQGTSDEESKERDQTEKSKKGDLESDISEPDEIDQRDNKVLFKSMKTSTKSDKDDLVDTDNDQDKNNEESE